MIPVFSPKALAIYDVVVYSGYDKLQKKKVPIMVGSATALWLDSSMAGFDHFWLSVHHFFAQYLGDVLTPIMRAITFLGEKGWIFFLLALLFMLTADKRDLGICIFGAVCCGALITNIILKDNVARLRPFESSVEYELWWNAVGSPAEDGFSFPSGHVTACAAGMTAITLMRGKKWIVPSVVIVLLMGISRNYLMAHYPSDVVAAILIGLFSGIVAWFITQIIFRYLNRWRKKAPICGRILEFDIRDILPFRLPALPFLKGRKAETSAPARPARGASTRPVRSAPVGDEDVKTFTRCYGCMETLDIPGGVCPRCGFDNTNGPAAQPGHVLLPAGNSLPHC